MYGSPFWYCKTTLLVRQMSHGRVGFARTSNAHCLLAYMNGECLLLLISFWECASRGPSLMFTKRVRQRCGGAPPPPNDDNDDDVEHAELCLVSMNWKRQKSWSEGRDYLSRLATDGKYEVKRKKNICSESFARQAQTLELAGSNAR